MSDPCARRGDNVMNLIQAMQTSGKGWSKREMQNFLFVRYRMGVREETLQNIIQQLIDRTIIYGKPTSPTSNVYSFYVNANTLEHVTGCGTVKVNIEKEKEREREKKRKKERGKK